MPYLHYKKLGGSDEKLIKTKRTIKGVGGGKPIPAKGFALMKLTVGSKTLATVFRGARELQFDSWARLDSWKSMCAF
jgi:hypothetical protein